MKRILLLATIACIARSGWAANGGMSGAFAANPDVPGQYGFTFNRTSPQQAEKIALSRCGDGCEIVEVYSGGCGVYAIDAARDDQVLGFAAAGSREEAEAAAVSSCQAQGGSDCRVGKSGCNGRRPGRSK